MPKQTAKPSNAPKYTVRQSKYGRFAVLADGRKIVEPPSGGKFSKREIRAAVAKARSKRLQATSS